MTARSPKPRRTAAPQVTRKVLKNGVRVNLVRMPHVHRSALDVHVRVGSRFETRRENGISHFHEHMLHRGIPGYPTAHAQALAFEELGAAFGAMTYVDHGVLSCSVPTENLERALELTALLCESPLFNDIAIEKGIVREELLEAYDGDGRLIDGPGILRQLCFGRHPLAMPIAGTRTTLARFDASALRKFHRRHYVGEGLVITLAGPDVERLGRVASRRFAGLPRGREVAAEAPPDQRAAQFRYLSDNTSQTWLGLGFRAPGDRDPDEPATELLMRVLDDGNATRLYRTLSDERGLCYDVSAMYEAYVDVGVLEIVAECTHTSAPRVLTETLNVLTDLATHGPTAEELSRAKARLRWQMLELYDMPTELAAFVGQGVLSDAGVEPEARIDELMNVTEARVREAAARIFRARSSSLVVVGKLDKSAQRKLQAAQAGLGA
ncbi:MAG: insulinase family protein [Myxococcales bacterium]|nr:MAG: insulinase family protein [Myxococcales bacterium]